MPSRPAARRWLAALLSGATAVSAVALTAAVTTVVTSSPAQARQTDGDVEMITANLKSALSVERFQSDVAKVLQHRPDFVAYNEVPMRNPAVFAPKGYAFHRGERNRYTRATPVVWRSDRWSAVDKGTYRISDYRKRPQGKNVKLGLRFANWAVLRSKNGRQVSVVSMHVAPVFRDNGKTYDLVRPSVKRLGKLMAALPKGPVLVGGDFNVHHGSGRYPRDLFDAAALVPTYDTLGTRFGTGDHGGATIDYIFGRGAYQLRATEHHRHEVNSDHDLVVGGFTWLTDPPNDTQRTVSDPGGTSSEQRAALRRVISTARNAPAGGRLAVATSDLAVRRAFRAIRGAVNRGVRVRYVTRSRTLSRHESRLRGLARRTGTMNFQRCGGSCRDRWTSSGVAPTLMLVRAASEEPRLRLDVDRKLNLSVVRRRTSTVSYTGDAALEEAARQLAALR